MDPQINGRLVKDLDKIRSHYLRTWFTVDFVSIVPFDLLSDLGNSSALEKLGVIRMVRLLRLLKMLRVLKANRMFKRWECAIAIPYASLSLAKFGVMILFFCHWQACLWGMVATSQAADEYTWLDQLAEAKPANLRDDVDESSGESAFSAIEAYSVSLYWAIYILTSIGLGDITPTSQLEYNVASVLMLNAAIFWAYVIGSFCSIISTMDVHGVLFRQVQ